MIYFVTKHAEEYRKSIDTKFFNDIVILDEHSGINLYFQLLGKTKVQAIDLEASGLDAYYAKPILYGLGNKDKQFMFDYTINVTPIFEHILKHKITSLGHNFKYDLKLIAVNSGVMLEKVYDTMVAEQRLYMKSGYRWSYEEVVKRYCKVGLIKSVRDEFIGVDPEKFKINQSHLYYLKGDLVNLFDIRVQQRRLIKSFKQEFLIYGIEFPMISAIAEAELDGFRLNVPKWKERIERDKARKFEIELRLDEIVKELRDSVSESGKWDIDPKIVLGGSKYNAPRVHNTMYDIFKSDGTTTELNLFGEFASHRDITRIKKKVVADPNNVNYNAKKDVVLIFAALGEKLITTTESVEIPKLFTKNGKTLVAGGVNRFSLDADLLDKFILLNPESKMREFLELKLEHSKLITALGTFGESFINKINKITGKLHTSFRQAFADTGRMQSGGGKKEPDKINYQNIPAKAEYRMCFGVDENYSVVTADYSGAELIVMASHAQDHKLIEISKGDMHSYMATRCWRNIYGYRASLLLKLFKNPKHKTAPMIEAYQKAVQLFRTFTVSKETPDLRKAFKGMTFGTIYGMYPKKAGATLNVIKEEGKVVIDTIKSEIPNTFAMVERASADAKRQGYLILNNRTNSRAWFPNLIKLQQGRLDEKNDFMVISNDLSEARNIRIQGTQADFIKEASVVLRKYFKKRKIDARILSWIHDELVVKIPKYLDGKSDEFYKFVSENPNFTLGISNKGNHYQNLEQVITDIMATVANRYLSNVEIGVDSHCEPHWIK